MRLSSDQMLITKCHGQISLSISRILAPQITLSRRYIKHLGKDYLSWSFISTLGNSFQRIWVGSLPEPSPGTRSTIRNFELSPKMLISQHPSINLLHHIPDLQHHLPPYIMTQLKMLQQTLLR